MINNLDKTIEAIYKDLTKIYSKEILSNYKIKEKIKVAILDLILIFYHIEQIKDFILKPTEVDLLVKRYGIIEDKEYNEINDSNNTYLTILKIWFDDVLKIDNYKDKFSIFKIDDSKKIYQNIPIESFEMSTEMNLDLRRDGIFTLGQLLSFSEDYLIQTKLSTNHQEASLLVLKVKELGLEFPDEILEKRPELFQEIPRIFYKNDPGILIKVIKKNYIYNDSLLRILRKYKTIERLINTPISDLVKIKGVGNKNIEFALDRLHSCGLYFKEEITTKINYDLDTKEDDLIKSLNNHNKAVRSLKRKYQ